MRGFSIERRAGKSIHPTRRRTGSSTREDSRASESIPEAKSEERKGEEVVSSPPLDPNWSRPSEMQRRKHPRRTYKCGWISPPRLPCVKRRSAEIFTLGQRTRDSSDHTRPDSCFLPTSFCSEFPSEEYA